MHCATVNKRIYAQTFKFSTLCTCMYYELYALKRVCVWVWV